MGMWAMFSAPMIMSAIAPQLLVFYHVPKTGGSSVREWLLRDSPLATSAAPHTTQRRHGCLHDTNKHHGANHRISRGRPPELRLSCVPTRV